MSSSLFYAGAGLAAAVTAGYFATKDASLRMFETGTKARMNGSLTEAADFKAPVFRPALEVDGLHPFETFERISTTHH